MKLNLIEKEHKANKVKYLSNKIETKRTDIFSSSQLNNLEEFRHKNKDNLENKMCKSNLNTSYKDNYRSKSRDKRKNNYRE